MRNEKREAKLDGASLVKNSGRGESKGDAKWKIFLVDYKHYAKTFSLSKASWKKMKKDSWNSDHREPLIKVVFDDNSSVAVVDWAWLQWAVEMLEDEGKL